MRILLRILGRVLFVILFIGAGVQKVHDPAGSVQYLTEMYPGYHKWYTSLSIYSQLQSAIPQSLQPYANQLNDLLQPAFIADHARQIITFIGYLELASSALIFFSVQLAGIALYAFTIATILVIHNPFVSGFKNEIENAIMNLAIAGVALFIAQNINPIRTVIIQPVTQDDYPRISNKQKQSKGSQSNSTKIR